MGNGLVLLANGAPLDVVHHPLLHSRPLDVFAHLSEGLVSSRVASGRMVVVDGHQGAFLGGGQFSLDPIDSEFVPRDQCHVLVIPVAMVCPRGAGQSVGRYVGLPGDVSDFIIIFLKVGVPAGGSSVEISWSFPILEVHVVSKDDKGGFSPAQVRPPMGECFHHGKQFPFIDVVVPFCGSECGGVVCDGVKLRFSLFVWRGIPFAPFLGEHCSNPVCRGVSLQVKASSEVGLDKDWFSTHEGFERFKCLELGVTPVPQ